ncbi:MAG: FixH family protein [Alphaproteobacteria bacterium]|nr:FixH family protein [Alphaproteobacteria bacterium]
MELPMENYNKVVKPFTGGKFFLWMLGFFGVIFAVNIVFVSVAIKSNPGVVDEHYYERGVNYNETLAQSDYQKSLGWSGVLNRTGDVIQFKLVDRHGSPVTGKELSLNMRRPAQAGQDFDVKMVEQSPGVYVGKLGDRPLGIWNGYFHAEWYEGKILREYDQLEPIELTK